MVETGKAARSGKKWNKCGLGLVITTTAGMCHGPSRHPSVKAGKSQKGHGRWKFQLEGLGDQRGWPTTSRTVYKRTIAFL